MNVQTPLLKRLSSVFLAMLLVLGGGSLLTACEEKGPAEKMGEKMDEAAEETGDAMEDAADEMEDSME